MCSSSGKSWCGNLVSYIRTCHECLGVRIRECGGVIWYRIFIPVMSVCLFDLGLTSLSTFFSHIATVSGCGRELNAHF